MRNPSEGRWPVRSKLLGDLVKVGASMVKGMVEDSLDGRCESN